jgi:hypothetical protein
MTNDLSDLMAGAQKLGYSGTDKNIYALRDWLRENHRIHVEVGSVWDEQVNLVEGYFYTVTVPIHIYHEEPRYYGGGKSHSEMLFEGVGKALELLQRYNKQKYLQVEDDDLVVAYLKGYSEKNAKQRKQPLYPTNIEEYAYLQGKQGDYIEEGLTDEDIVVLVRNELKEEEQYRLE